MVLCAICPPWVEFGWNLAGSISRVSGYYSFIACRYAAAASAQRATKKTFRPNTALLCLISFLFFDALDIRKKSEEQYDLENYR